MGGVYFYEGIFDLVFFIKWFFKGGLLVLDDLMEEGGKDKIVLDFFIKFFYYKGIIVIYLM